MRPTHSISTDPRFKNITLEQGGAVISKAKTVMIVAPAGSGKTTTSMAYACARPKARGLYLAFAKPVQDEANARLRSLQVNTVSRTQHSMAHDIYGSAMRRAGKLSTPGLRSATTSKHLGVNYRIASAVNETLRLFMSSPDDVMDEAHLPAFEDFPIVDRNAGAILDGARTMWSRLITLDDVEVQATDDVYLKQWVMSKPVLPYDFILLDEWQDANSLIAHLVKQQAHATRVYVGDPHQAIFGFRGAVNMMEGDYARDVESHHTLTQSFRFPKRIGTLATVFLRHWKNNTSPILGMGPGGRATADDQVAWLARTGAGLIAKGIELHAAGKKMHWIKGFDEYKVGPILQAYDLFHGNRENITDPVLKLMQSWSHFEDYVESSGDGEARPVYKMIEKHRDEIPNIVRELREHQVADVKEAKIVLTTAHRSKGLEFPVVRLINDFFTFKDRSGSWKKPKDIDPQEANLMYVALTRAQKGVAPTAEIAEWFRTQPETKDMFPLPPTPVPRPAAEEDANTQAALPRAA
jgi:hypothetical protein